MIIQNLIDEFLKKHKIEGGGTIPDHQFMLHRLQAQKEDYIK